MDSLTSQNQLSQLYQARPHDLAQSLVYGKQKKQSGKQSGKPAKENVRQQKIEPSALTLLSQKLFNHIPQQLSEFKSSRAFYSKENQMLLSPERLHSMPSSSARPMFDVSNRLLEYKTLIVDKKERIKEQVINEQLEECTFQPQINDKSRSIAVKSTFQEVRSADQFHDDQMKMQQYYLEKKEIAIETFKQEELALLSSPKISGKSKQLAKQKFPNAHVVERLYQPKPNSQQQVSAQQQDPENTFKPEISKKSKTIKRDKPVEEYLFEDAKKRKEILQQTTLQAQQQQQQVQKVGSSDNTAGWFVQRFIKDFYFQLSNLERINVSDQKDFSRLTYSETLQILVGLQLLRPISNYENQKCPQLLVLASLWKQLSNSQNSHNILSRNLLVLLLAVLNIPAYHIEIPLYKSNSDREDNQMGCSDELFQRRANYLQKDDSEIQEIANQIVQYNLSFDDSFNLQVNEEDVLYLHGFYKELYYNFRLQKGNGLRRSHLTEEDGPFSPKLTKVTHKLGTKKRNGASLNEWFRVYETERKERFETLKSEVEQLQLQECRFSGVSKMTIDLKQLARAVVKREDRAAVDIEFERQREHCIFKPQISAGRTFQFSGDDEQIKKTSVRLKEARVRNEALREMKSKGFTTNNKTRKQMRKNSEEGQRNEIAPVKLKTERSQPMFRATTVATDKIFNLSEDEERVPLLFVDVNIEEGKTARIVVFSGDNSEELAERFCCEYHLDESMKIKLKELLELQINSLLTKIEEENESDNDFYNNQL